jgi:hypothetical protein
VLAVYRGSLFSNKINVNAVLVNKLGNLQRAYRLSSNLRHKILYYLARRRQGSCSKVFNILYKFCFLLWVDFVSLLVLGFLRALTLLVSSSQSCTVNIEFFGG